jgi:hypothetical protein
MKEEHTDDDFTFDNAEGTDSATPAGTGPDLIGQLNDFAPSRRGFLSNTAKVGAGAAALGALGTGTAFAEGNQQGAEVMSGLTTKTNGKKRPGTGGFTTFGERPFLVTENPEGGIPQHMKVACEGDERTRYHVYQIFYEGDEPKPERESYLLIDGHVETGQLYEFVGDASNCPGEEKPPFEFLQVQFKPVMAEEAANSPYEEANRFGYGALTDVEIIRFALLLERLEATFYTDAVGDEPIAEMGTAGSAEGARLTETEVESSDIAQQFANPSIRYSTFQRFKQVRNHEQAHVDALEGVLAALQDEGVQGANPDFASGVEFDFPYETFGEFLDLARAFEDTGAGAYTAAAPAIDEEKYLASAAQILAVEARHASYIRVLNNPLPPGTGALNPFPRAFQRKLSVSTVAQRVIPFIEGVDEVSQVVALVQTG